MSKFLDDNTYATTPGCISLSQKKFYEFYPEFKRNPLLNFLRSNKNKKMYIEYLKEHLNYGDSQPAVVIAIDPLIVAAYSDEFDSVVLLSFSKSFSDAYNLQIGSKLLSVNLYNRNTTEKDITHGPKTYNRYKNFHPVIAEFISDEMDYIEIKKKQVLSHMWDYVYSLGVSAINKENTYFRNGDPLRSSSIAE
ncbi:MAG: hypothetical protein ACRC2K_05500 [Clostridium sp.]